MVTINVRSPICVYLLYISMLSSNVQVRTMLLRRLEESTLSLGNIWVGPYLSRKVSFWLFKRVVLLVLMTFCVSFLISTMVVRGLTVVNENSINVRSLICVYFYYIAAASFCVCACLSVPPFRHELRIATTHMRIDLGIIRT